MLDTKDRKIMYQLCKDARIPLTKLAKKVGLSREVVNYRIKNLLNREIIQSFVSIVETSKLGYTVYGVFLQLQNANEEIETKIMNFLSKHPFMTFVSKSLGDWDIAIEFCARDIEHFDSIINEINKKFNKYIRNKETFIIKFEHTGMVPGFIQGEVNFIRVSMIGEKAFKIDKKDMEILRILSNNAREKITDIAKKVKISSDSVIYRMKNMKKAGIIKGYRPVLNTNKLNCLRYTILFELQGNKTDEKIRDFIYFLKKYPNSSYITECLGKYEIYVYLVIREPEELRAFLMEVKNRFTGMIKSYNILHMFEEYKNEYLPSGIVTNR